MWRASNEAIRFLRPQAWLLEGLERWSQNPLRLLFCGTAAHKNYFACVAFGTSYKETDLGPTWIKDLLAGGRSELNPAVTIVQSSLHPLTRFAGKNSYIIPGWVDGIVDLRNTFESALHTGNVKEDLRRIRKNRLEYEVRHDPQAYADFYHGMYTPHIKRIHAGRAILSSYKSLQAKRPDSELLIVKMAGRDVAGIVIVYEKQWARTRDIGVKDGDRRYAKTGALAALYYFSLWHIKRKGYRIANLGGSRAFLDDGVLQFKKKWSLRLTTARSLKFILQIDAWTHGVSGLLVSNPFIHETDRGLRGALFVEEQKPITDKDITAWKQKYAIAGITGFDLRTVPLRR